MTTSPAGPYAGSPLDPPVRPSGPERLTVRSPEDALAAVPVILGFEPEESVVVLTFGGRETFHARVDLPRGYAAHPADLTDTLTLMLEPCLRHQVAGVVLVVYSGDPVLATAAEEQATDAFEAAGIRVIATVRADGRRWWAPGWLGGGGPDDGVPYDVSGHRFRAQSVLRGRVVHESRKELAALLDPVPSAVASVRAARRRASSVGAAGVTMLVERGVVVGRLRDADLAVLLVSLRRPAGRDAAWAGIGRTDADDHVRFWTDVVQRAPADLVAAPAAVLAMAAWLAGHGALAWCAVDRCRSVDPRNTLAALVDQALTQALSPSVWDRIRDELAVDG